MTIKTDASRFHIHDELTAPDASAPLIKSIQTAGGAVSSSSACSPSPPLRCAAIPDCAPSSARASCRGRPVSASASPSPSGATTPTPPTQYARTARVAGLGLDEVARARNFTSSDEKEAALLALLRETINPPSGRPTTWSRRRVRRAGATRRSSTRSRSWPWRSSRACSPQLRRCPRRATPRSCAKLAQRLARRRRHGRLDRTGPDGKEADPLGGLLGQVPGVALPERPAVDNGRGHAQAAVAEGDLRAAGKLR